MSGAFALRFQSNQILEVLEMLAGRFGKSPRRGTTTHKYSEKSILEKAWIAIVMANSTNTTGRNPGAGARASTIPGRTVQFIR